MTTKKKEPTVLQKRVLIARDVIKQLKARRYIAIQHFLLGSEFTRLLNRYSNESAQVKLKAATTCEVCAKGACLLAYVERFNSVSEQDLLRADGWSRVSDVSSFTDVFPSVLIDEIETLYERRDYCFEQGLTKAFAQSVVEFSRTKLDNDPEKRLLQIMRRLVKNKGRYVAFPEVARK